MRETHKSKNTLYLFDLKNEFGEATNNSGKTKKTFLNAFVQFAIKEKLLMPGINLFCLLTKWGPSLKINKNYLKYESKICSAK